ncbi:MAG TPA: zinc ribbon domain-containing protein [Anaerolineales bacterium]|nr:zinc ribbon domain-containing protein [Anaerolineales bacterium]
MDLSAILLLIALLLGIGFYLAAPLISDATPHSAKEETGETSSLMAERDRIINSLQELDFDFRLGKIPDEDYPTQRRELLQKGADILRQLDALQPRPLSDDEVEQRIERAAAARRADAATQAQSLSDDEIESMLAARRKQRKSRSAGFCPKCGKAVLITDQFCANCGKALK